MNQIMEMLLERKKRLYVKIAELNKKVMSINCEIGAIKHSLKYPVGSTQFISGSAYRVYGYNENSILCNEILKDGSLSKTSKHIPV